MRRQPRHDFPAQRVAPVAYVEVAVVLDPFQAVPRGVVAQAGPAGAEQGAQLRGAPARPPLQLGHGRQTLRPGTTQQLQQQRLGLIVLLVCGEQEIRCHRSEDALPRTPRRGFNAGGIVARDRHAMDAQVHAMRRAPARAEIRPLISVRRQTMVDVNGLQGERMDVPQGEQDVQQHHRIETPGKRQRQPGTGRDAADQHVRHAGNERFTWQEFP